nr:nonribosomal peptide synthetase [Alternaria alternata]BBG74283.1 nonribosomal peptide synthetase [Alternaria alternata]
MASLEHMKRIWGEVLGIEPDEIGLDENFVDSLQLLGEVASYNVQIDLETFTNTGTIQTLWEAMNDTQTRNVHSMDGRDYNTDSEGLDVVEAASASIVTKTDTDNDDLALEQARLVQDNVLCVAPISPVQGFFLDLGLAGQIGLINYIFEVEGSDLKHGLAHVTNLLESKNPVFRTLIEKTKESGFVQILVAKTRSSWFYPSDLRLYLEKTMTQKFELGKPAVQYALVMEDAAHEGRNFFVISMHHTHCDAFSRFLIGKEISQILESPSYYARSENIERPWFGNYVKHVQQKATDDKASLFWDAYMCGANLANIYPLHRATLNGEFDGAIIEKIQAPVATRIADGSPRNSTQVILAAWAIALANLSGLRDITFGLCRHGRSSSSFRDVRRLMGPLVNVLPFRVSLICNEEPAPALLQRIQNEITSTNKHEHGFSPCIFPSTDGRPWVQSLVDLKSELHGMGNGPSARSDHLAISKMVPRPDLDTYEMKSHWAVLLSIRQHRNVFQVSMYYQKPLLAEGKAVVLFENFRACIQALSTGQNSVGELLE